MGFTELRLSGLLVALLLLSACATGPTTQDPDPSAEQPQEPSALPSGDVTPNPYTQQRSAVPPRARTLFEQALAAMEQNQWRQAQTLLLQLSQEFPRLSGPQVNLGLVYWAQDEPERAAQAFEQALAINAKNLDAYNQLALLKRTQGDFDAAERLYTQALEVWPFHAPSHRNIGILYDLYRGDWDRALLHYRAYQQLQEQPDPEMNGWIIDLERRINATQ